MNNKPDKVGQQGYISWKGNVYTGSDSGFGRLWMKSYEALISSANISPEEVILIWRKRFFHLWPAGSGPKEAVGTLNEGDTSAIQIGVLPGVALETGFLVVFVGNAAFTLMTRSDHPFSGWIHFTADKTSAGVLVRTQAVVRPRDPLWEAAFRLGILTMAEDAFWEHALRELADLWSSPTEVVQESTLLDKRVRWTDFSEIRKNSGLRLATRPIMLVSNLVKSTLSWRRRWGGSLFLAAGIIVAAASFLQFQRRK